MILKKNQNAQKYCSKKTKAHNGLIITKVVSTCLIAVYSSSLNEFFSSYPLNVKIDNFNFKYFID